MRAILNRFSKGEIRDATFVWYALGLLKMDEAENSEFIDAGTKETLEFIKEKITDYLKPYGDYRQEIYRKVERLTNVIVFTKEDYQVQLTMLALNMLATILPANERQGRPLGRNLTELWEVIGNDVRALLDKYFDEVSEDIAEQTWRFTLDIIGKM